MTAVDVRPAAQRPDRVRPARRRACPSCPARCGTPIAWHLPEDRRCPTCGAAVDGQGTAHHAAVL
ncbi:hypothetical protein [Saccharothrix sp. HUAS TT1]|uniref:hypothetical protein n=1 Tax=unclassified Saccharothrix TaxID=2593673 RepID=UPI00345C4310